MFKNNVVMIILTALYLIRLVLADWDNANMFTFATGTAGGLLAAYWFVRGQQR